MGGCMSHEEPDWEITLKAIEKDVDTLRKNESRLGKVVESQAFNFEEKRKKTVNQIQERLDEYRNLSNIENQSQREIEQLQQLQNQRDQLLEQKSKETDELRKKYNDAINELKRESDRSENILEGTREIEAECEQLKKNYKDKEEECTNLLKMVQIGESKIDEVQIQSQRLDEEKKSLKKQLAECEQQIKDYKENLHIKESTLDKNYKETESLQQHVADYRNKEERLRQELEEKADRVKSLEVENKDYLSHITSLTQELDDKTVHVKTLEVENNDYKNQITRFEKSFENYEKEMKTIESQLNEVNTQNNRLEKSVENYEKEMRVLESQLNEAKMENNSLMVQVTEYYNKNCDLETELRSREKNHNQSINRLQETINNLHQSVIAERKAKDDALNRLSAAAASRLRDNNPSITDLSDPNRPLKLAEKISELYDNEWTNAMENLEDIDVGEEDGVALLLSIFTKIFERCRDIAAEHLKNLSQILVLPEHIPVNKTESKIGNLPSLPSEILKPIKDFRKIHASKAIAVIQEVIRAELGDAENPLIRDLSKDRLEACEEYVQKCVELSWMMRVQDPPVHMKWNFEKNDQFNADLLRSYTKSGKFVDFVVWPVLYLHEDGPLLSKGVAQGKKNCSQNEKKVVVDATGSTGEKIPSTSFTTNPLAEKEAIKNGPSSDDSAIPDDSIRSGQDTETYSCHEDLSERKKDGTKSKKSSTSSYESASDDDVKSDDDKSDTDSVQPFQSEGDTVNSLPSQDSTDTKETAC